MNKLGLGTGDFFWDAPIQRNQKIDLIKESMDLGIGLIDTAEGYGDSEVLVGEAIAGRSVEAVIATKVSPQNLSKRDMYEACVGSLEKLGLSIIPLYQVHWPNPHIPLEETIEGLMDLVERKLVDSVGFCNFSTESMAWIGENYPELPFRFAQLEFNLFERYADINGSLAYCAEKDINFLAYSPLDQGQHSSMNSDQTTCMDRLCEEYSISTSQLMLAYVMGKEIMTPLVRTTSRKHLVENVQAMQVTLEAEDQLQLERLFHQEVFEIPVGKIKVSLEGEWNRAVYQTLDEALENKLGYSPSPLELSTTIKKEGLLKPVRLKRITNGDYEYELVAGRIRYWAWVIAHPENDVTISAYLRM